MTRDLFTYYPWLVPRCGDAAISEVVRVLDRAQAFTAGGQAAPLPMTP